MRTPSKGLLGALLALLALLALALSALVLAIDGSPAVGTRDDVSPADVERAVALARLHDPRNAALGQLRRLPLQERDVDLLAYYAARRWLAANARVELQPGRMRVQASFAAPLGRWVNVELGLRQTAVLPEIDRLRVGRLPLPPEWAMALIEALAARRGIDARALTAQSAVQGVTLAPGELAVTYRIGQGTAGNLRAALVSPADQERLRAYQERLAFLTNGASQRVSIVSLLTPLFALAVERSAGGDAAAENRAALLTLTVFANRWPLELLTPAAATWSPARPLRLTLRQRDDSALHFLISAVIAAEAGTPLADAVGVWKELADARGAGSGFSFNDLAADRAGTRFGELAVRAAPLVQARIAAGAAEADFMPSAADLPEGLPEAELQERYGGVGGAGYRRVLADIEARIAALPLYR